MITIPRKDFKANPWCNLLYDIILKNHVVPQHIHDYLNTNTLPEGLGVGSRAFVHLEGDGDGLYIHYDTVNSLDKGIIQVTITEICVYDGYNEYEPIRLKSLHSNPNVDGINLN